MQVQHVDSLKRPIPYESQQALSQRFADYRRRLEGTVVEEGHDLSDLREAYWEGGVEKGEHHGTWPVGWSRRYIRELRKLAGVPEPKPRTPEPDSLKRTVADDLLDVFRQEANWEGWSVGIRELAERVQSNRMTVTRAVNKLVREKKIRVHKNTGGRTVYTCPTN